MPWQRQAACCGIWFYKKRKKESILKLRIRPPTEKMVKHSEVNFNGCHPCHRMFPDLLRLLIVRLRKVTSHATVMVIRIPLTIAVRTSEVHALLALITWLSSSQHWTINFIIFLLLLDIQCNNFKPSFPIFGGFFFFFFLNSMARLGSVGSRCGLETKPGVSQILLIQELSVCKIVELE